MTIEQHRHAENALGAFDETAQGLVVGLVQSRDAGHRFVNRDRPFVNFLSVPDDARDGAEPAGDAQRTAIDEIRQASLEHQRIEFERLTVEVDEGAGKIRAHQRRADADAGREQFVDESIFRTAQRQRVETRSAEKSPGIEPAGMRRIENERRCETVRLENFKRRRRIGALEVGTLGPLAP